MRRTDALHDTRDVGTIAENEILGILQSPPFSSAILEKHMATLRRTLGVPKKNPYEAPMIPGDVIESLSILAEGVRSGRLLSDRVAVDQELPLVLDIRAAKNALGTRTNDYRVDGFVPDQKIVQVVADCRAIGVTCIGIQGSLAMGEEDGPRLTWLCSIDFDSPPSLQLAEEEAMVRKITLDDSQAAVSIPASAKVRIGTAPAKAQES